MKIKYKALGIAVLVIIIGFSMAACDNGSGPAHTHQYGAWQSNSTQHWKECSCGEEYGRANHTGNPCPVCGYDSSISASLYGTYGYTATGQLTITFRNNGTFTGNYISSSPVNGSFTVSGENIKLSEHYYGKNWTIINSTTVMDEDGDYWHKR